MFFNNNVFNNAKVRQAVAYALNRQLIVEQLLKGQGEVIDGSIPSDNPHYNKEVPPYTFDLEKAKALLK